MATTFKELPDFLDALENKQLVVGPLEKSSTPSIDPSHNISFKEMSEIPVGLEIELKAKFAIGKFQGRKDAKAAEEKKDDKPSISFFENENPELAKVIGAYEQKLKDILLTGDGRRTFKHLMRRPDSDSGEAHGNRVRCGTGKNTTYYVLEGMEIREVSWEELAEAHKAHKQAGASCYYSASILLARLNVKGKLERIYSLSASLRSITLLVDKTKEMAKSLTGGKSITDRYINAAKQAEKDSAEKKRQIIIERVRREMEDAKAEKALEDQIRRELEDEMARGNSPSSPAPAPATESPPMEVDVKTGQKRQAEDELEGEQPAKRAKSAEKE